MNGASKTVESPAAQMSDYQTVPSYCRARYYDPAIGRFPSEDRARFKGGVNFYTYALNNPVLFVDPSGFFVEILCEPVHQFGLGLIVRGDGARHCRVHVRCDGPGSKYDVTYELNGPGAGALRADPFDRSRPVNPQVPVKPPPACTNGNCKFENCITKLFAFDVKAEANGKTALPDYNPINANSNAFVRNLVVSCGGQMSYPPYPWGFFGQMPD